MSFETLYIHLQDIARRLDEQMPEVGIVQAMDELKAEWTDRIFLYGKNSSGGQIGEYSTEPAYFSRAAFIRGNAFMPNGKNSSEKTFKNGKPRKSMYLPLGYSEFRSIQDREPNFVNLKFGGSMEGAFKVYKFGSEALFGNADAAEHQKVIGNEDRFGDWASLSEAEKEYLRQQLTEQAVIIVKRTDA